MYRRDPLVPIFYVSKSAETTDGHECELRLTVPPLLPSDQKLLVIYRSLERDDTPATRSAAHRICALTERAPRLFEIDP
jgi:hypothetical protein